MHDRFDSGEGGHIGLVNAASAGGHEEGRASALGNLARQFPVLALKKVRSVS
jgi:hypothetical protein